ncbi:MAG: hypothetical protein AAFN30_03795 [Actinomycetota bacterium]
MNGPFQPPSPSPWQPPTGPGGSTLGGSLPPPAPAPEQRVTKGGGGGPWLLIVLGAVAVLFLFWLVFASIGDSSPDADERAGTGEENTADDPLTDPDGGGGLDEDGGPFGGAPGGGGAAGDRFRPDSVAVDERSVWVSDVVCGIVVQIDKDTEEVVAAIDLGGSASGVAIADGSVWIGTREQGRIVRLDRDDLTVEDVVTVPGYALGLGATENEVWATDPFDGVVYRIDATTGALLTTVDVGLEAHHIAIGPSVAWVTNNADDTVTRIELGEGGPSQDLPVGSRPLHVELGVGSAWVTNSSDGTVHRLSEAGEIQEVIEVGPRPHALAVAAGSVWIGTESGEFWRIDPATNTAAQVEGATFDSIDTAVDGTDIWVADTDAGIVVRFDATAAAGAGAVASTVDLGEFGDCETFRSEAVTPPLVNAV